MSGGVWPVRVVFPISPCGSSELWVAFRAWHRASLQAPPQGSSQTVHVSLTHTDTHMTIHTHTQTHVKTLLPGGQRVQASNSLILCSFYIIRREGRLCLIFVSINLASPFPLSLSLSLSLPLSRSLSPSLQSNRQPVKLNLLTCQVKPSAEDRKCFDLISRE